MNSRLSVLCFCLSYLTYGQTPQTIDSKGNGNLNINTGSSSLVVVQPTVNETVRNIIQKTLINSHEQPEAWQGTLLPGHAKTDLSSCDYVQRMTGHPFQPSPTGLVVQAGTSAFICEALSCNVIRTKDAELVSVVRDRNSIKVTARVLTNEGLIIVKLEANRFFVNPNQTYRPPERSLSGLTVYDQRDNKVLDLDFLNAQTIRIRGIFNDGHGKQLHISDSEMINDDGNQIGGLCSESRGLTLGNRSNNADLSIGAFLFGGSTDPAFLPPSAHTRVPSKKR